MSRNSHRPVRLNATLSWLKLLQQVDSEGYEVNARGFDTVEVLNNVSTWDMNYPIVDVPERSGDWKKFHRFSFTEAAWIMEGSNRLRPLLDVAPSYEKYSDDGLTMTGAYGPKILEQMNYICETLVKDPGSRQAVLTIWRERPGPSKDIPCTVSMQFFVRDNELHMLVNMRSSDIWTGVPHDVFTFSMIAFGFLMELRRRYCENEIDIDLTLGRLTLVAGSQHYYMRNHDSIKKILEQYKNQTFYGNQYYMPLGMYLYDTSDWFTVVAALKGLLVNLHLERTVNERAGPFGIFRDFVEGKKLADRGSGEEEDSADTDRGEVDDQ